MIKWLWEGFKLFAICLIAWFCIQIVSGCAAQEEIGEFERESIEYDRRAAVRAYETACHAQGGVVFVVVDGHQSSIRRDSLSRARVRDLQCVSTRDLR